MKFSEQRRTLMMSDSIIQVPWVKVTIGDYTFGCYTRKGQALIGDFSGGSQPWVSQFPNYVQSLNVTKINGQVNQYTLVITYPITQHDDPNFFEKVFSSVSKTRKIVFTYGDCSKPAYIYKDEEAIITKIGQAFSLKSSAITYTIYAVSGAQLKTLGCRTFTPEFAKPSDVIKRLFKDESTGLKSTFTGMDLKSLDRLIPGDDKAVQLDLKINESVLDYLTYLVSCMYPANNTQGNISPDIYILTMHDDTIYDKLYNSYTTASGPYFKVEKTSYLKSHADAVELDIGYNNSTIVTDFGIEQNENYALYYDYQSTLVQDEFVRRVGDDGKLIEEYSPNVTSKNRMSITRPNDITWWTKITQYPIKASLTVQGLLRPAYLMTYLRLNILFYGEKYIGSGLYIVTSQTDEISSNGYKTKLTLTKIQGED